MGFLGVVGVAIDELGNLEGDLIHWSLQGVNLELELDVARANTFIRLLVTAQFFALREAMKFEAAINWIVIGRGCTVDANSSQARRPK